MISVLPIFSAFVVGLLLFGIFTWNTLLLLFVILCIYLLMCLYFSENDYFNNHFVFSFWLFIFSEIAIFSSLIFCCLYFDYSYYTNLSSALELPFLGCFILLGSSLVVTSYHHLINWYWSYILLLLTIFLGIGFVFLQINEMNEVIVTLYDNVFYASSFCTVGLHFIHVVIGIIGLITIFVIGLDNLGYYRCSIIVWYWHFVDYVWLFVYTFVYVC